jgi:hypothetical protein
MQIDHKRRWVCLAILTCLQSSFAFSQTNIGFKAGLTVSNWAYSEPTTVTQERKMGIQAALPIEINFNQLIALQPEFCFIQKGDKTEFGNGSYTSKVSTNNLEVPLLLKLKFGKSMAFVINGGLYGGFALKGKVKYEGSSNSAEEREIDFEKDKVRRADAGVILGIGFKAPMNNGYFTMDLRYTYGLTDLSMESSNDLKVHNEGFNLAIGFLIPANRKKTGSATALPAETK